MGTVWEQPSPSDFDRWQQLVLDGRDPSSAARELGFGGSSTFKRTDPERHWDVLELWRERQRSEDHQTSRDTLRTIATSETVEPKDRNRAAELLGKASGYLADKTAVEVTGADGGPVALTVQEAKENLAARLAAIAERRGAAEAPGGAD